MHSGNEKWRLFFAFWPSAPVRQGIFNVSQCLPARYGRTVAAENLHLTLLFLGQVEQQRLDNLLDAAECIKPVAMTLQFDKLCWWRTSRVIALLADSVPAPVLKLHAALGEIAVANGLTVDDRPYRPHITLMRKVAVPPQLPAITALKWPLREYCLVRSERKPAGPGYEVIWRNR